MTIPYAGLGPSAEYPAELVAVTRMAGGIRFITLGEDAERYVFLGHQYHRDVIAALEQIVREDDIDQDEPVDREELAYTYARYMTKCLAHTADVEECTHCQMVRFLEQPDGFWLDWSTSDGNPKSNRGRHGHFPVVIWDVDV